MALKLMYITNKPEVALIAEAAGVDWIFIDLETIGKSLRQGHLDTVQSNHNINDIRKIRKILTHAKLLVRINPIHKESKVEIEQVIQAGADIVMLPYFKTVEEVEHFTSLIKRQVKSCILCETPEAVENIDSILEVPGIDYVHIGLNDLHLGYGMTFMFELLANGTVEYLANKIRRKNIPFGFGGIARLGQGTLPAEKVIAEHYRLGSEMAILSRSFCNYEVIEDLREVKNIFQTGINEIRKYEQFLEEQQCDWFFENQHQVKKLIDKITTTKTSSTLHFK
ncbi:MAG TPA: aldolase/citrate lyase family protein [Mariniphaga sp.]|nr:aldolase/citrate lyase family protein [Mariniphaga sp.]